MIQLLLAVSAIGCAVAAVRASRLLASALWLAGVSAMVALSFALMGATQVAVIELSVGAGLVTVLFVFSIGIAGDEAIDARSVVPRSIALVLVLAASTLTAIFILPGVVERSPTTEAGFADVLWNIRGADVMLQLVLIFSGVVGVLSLLTEGEAPAHPSIMVREVSQEMAELTEMALDEDAQ
jgi:NADH:ubiquinone oxidoreductase subunit 6 (subunit J)